MAPVLLGQNKAAEPSETTHVAAFMVLIGKDGSCAVETDINKPVIPERKANISEMKSSLSAILDDIQVQETAMLAMQLMEQRAQQAFEAHKNQQMAAGLKL